PHPRSPPLFPSPTLSRSRLGRTVAAVAADRGAAEEEVWQEYVAQNSLGRLPTADELAWAVELLLDPEADLLHGSVLYLDAAAIADRKSTSLNSSPQIISY